MAPPVRVFGSGELPGKRVNDTRPQRKLNRVWSANDADHIPRGRRVLLLRSPEQMHPSLEHLHVLGLEKHAPRVQTGTTEGRQVDGSFMVRLDGTTLSVAVMRADLLYPIPENVSALSGVAV